MRVPIGDDVGVSNIDDGDHGAANAVRFAVGHVQRGREVHAWAQSALSARQNVGVHNFRGNSSTGLVGGSQAPGRLWSSRLPGCRRAQR